jgi:hypothetical protein
LLDEFAVSFNALLRLSLRVLGLWEPSVSGGDELMDFQDFTDEGIEQIRQAVHSSTGDPWTGLGEVERRTTV